MQIDSPFALATGRHTVWRLAREHARSPKVLLSTCVLLCTQEDFDGELDDRWHSGDSDRRAGGGRKRRRQDAALESWDDESSESDDKLAAAAAAKALATAANKRKKKKCSRSRVLLD